MYIMYVSYPFPSFLNPPPIGMGGSRRSIASDASFYFVHIVPMWKEHRHLGRVAHMDVCLSYMSSGFVGPTAELHGPPHLSSERMGRCPIPHQRGEHPSGLCVSGRWPTPTKTQKLNHCVIKFLVSWTFKAESGKQSGKQKAKRKAYNMFCVSPNPTILKFPSTQISLNGLLPAIAGPLH